jgi:methylated-DNA-protein-cysteine methyltransferase related protein
VADAAWIVKPSCTFENIWRVVAKVPRGRVATYGQIARMAGLFNGARTVGWALRALPDGRRIGGRPIPWHRVVNAQGTISLRGRDGGEADRQGRALRSEGIRFAPGGRIELGRYLWRGYE